MKRIDQWLANLGYCSRSESRIWIDGKRVTAAGKFVKNGSEKASAEALRVDGHPLDHPGGILLMLNKPLDVVCSHEEREGKRVYDLLPERWTRRNPVITSIGRLDRDTTGLLLLTDQSPLVHLLTSPKHKVPKLYRATLDAPTGADRQQEIVKAFASGELKLAEDPKACLPAELTWTGERAAEITLTEGRYHQVRRMFAGQGLMVVDLQRVKFGTLNLPGDLAVGEFRELPLDQKFM